MTISHNLLTQNDWENPAIIHQQRLPSRGYFIPYAKEEEALTDNIEGNERYFNLNGDWKFNWAPRFCDTPANFYQPEYDCSSWDTITVPSNWQCQGYCLPRYTNIYYAFPYAPPHVPVDNPIGSYRRTFKMTEDAFKQRQILHFDGVDSAFHVWINGQFAGFSKGARCAAEFDITDLLTLGENSISVRVYRWSDGSYLEAQDMWFISGIFRNVYILSQPTISVWDYRIDTELSNNYQNARIKIDIDLDNISAQLTTQKLELHLLQSDITEALSPQTQTLSVPKGKTTTSFTFHMNNPLLWSAEFPNLYTLTILLIDEYGNTIEAISHPVGIRDISWQNCQLKVNGRQIMLRGANRHEHDPDLGRTQTLEHMNRDLTLMKQNNFNAIRFSHYPPDPRLLTLCDQYGFYVMDEADLETHGAQQAGDQALLSQDPQWQAAYLDRVQRMYYRDRNHACIIIWSLGNECGLAPNVPNIKTCFNWLKDQDSTRPVHYPQDHPEKLEDQFTDFCLCGYCNMDTVREKAAMNTGGRPVIATEYGHAMGNGPGGMKDYWEIFNQRGQMHGGFVWEWIEHGISSYSEDGEKYYLYGGDFGDSLSDTNFCLDGLLFPDGTPTPALAEFKKVMEPISIEAYDISQGEFTLINRHDFTSLDQFILNWEIKSDNEIIRSESMELPAIAPNSEQLILLPLKIDELEQSGADYWLNLSFTFKEIPNWAINNHHIITQEQFKLPVPVPSQPGKTDSNLPEISWEQIGNDLIITFTASKVVFDISKGTIKSWEQDGEALINSGPKLNLWRAPIDNDGTTRRPMLAGEWAQKQLFNVQFIPQTFTVNQQAPGILCLEISGISAPEGWSCGFKCNYIYTIYSSGEIRIDLSGIPYGAQMPEILPRIGLQMTLPNEFTNATWYGMGPEESYPDCSNGNIIGIYQKTVRDLHTNYSHPQENGSRSKTRWLSLNNDNNIGITAYAQPEFSFSAHHYSQECLTKAKHTIDLKDSGEITLNLDYAMRGIGSASCGPPPEEDYELHPHPFHFSIYLSSGNGEEAIQHSRNLPPQILDLPILDKQSSAKQNQQSQHEEKRDIFACD